MPWVTRHFQFQQQQTALFFVRPSARPQLPVMTMVFANTLFPLVIPIRALNSLIVTVWFLAYRPLQCLFFLWWLLPPPRFKGSAPFVVK